jgi:two-component system OmpR family sensor kinase
MNARSSSGTGGQAAGPRHWLAGRTLRGRLIAGLVALLALACAAVGLVTYVALRGSLIGQLDQQLRAASIQFAHCEEGRGGGESDNGRPSRPAPPEQDCGDLPGQANGTFSATVTGGKVRGVAITPKQPAPLSAGDKRALAALPADHQSRSYTLTSLGPYRLQATSAPGGSSYITGLPLSPINATLRRVELTEVIVFSAALLLTGLIGTGWVRLSLRPLRRVATTATRVTELPLASGDVNLPERVPDADPRTEVGQVGTAFNRMLGHVESALTRRAASEARLRRFAADASHELRTPLAAIRGYAELARRHPGPVPDDIAHALRRVESESARMSVLVDELLLLAQLDAGRPLAKEPVDLTRLAIDATSDARVAAPDHKWQLELPGEPVLVRGDEHRLRQVLANLLSNAGSHTPAGTTVTVTLTEPGPGASSVMLSVTDNGPGIPADLQPGLFERFVRGDSSRSHATGSTGLGLAIVDAVTAAHGGSVGVTSRPGWTRFVITLPGLEGPLSARPGRSGRSQPGQSGQPDQPVPPAEPDQPGQAAQPDRAEQTGHPAQDQPSASSGNAARPA